MLRHGLRRLLEDEPDLEVVAEAGNAAEALREISEQRPDVAIVDANLFAPSAAEAEQMILRESPVSRVIFLPNTSEQSEFLGSDHPKCVSRQSSVDDLLMMVREGAVPAGSSAATAEQISIEEAGSRKRVLTAREWEVLKLLAEGRTVRSVAAILGLSVKTVDAHKFNLMRKLGIHNKAELVMWAIQKKVVKLPVNF